MSTRSTMSTCITSQSKVVTTVHRARWHVCRSVRGLYCAQVAWTLCTVMVLHAPKLAHAGGLEVSPGGTYAASRGGAAAASPVDAMAMLHNPAALALLPSDQFMLNLDTTFYKMCVEPYGYYGWGVYAQSGVDDVSEFGPPQGQAYSERPLDRVCNSAPVLPIPQLAWAFRAGKRLTFALGFVAPSVVAGLQFGGADGTIATDSGARPTPTRYQLIRQEVPFALNPTASVGFALTPKLAIGVTFQVLMAKVRNLVASTLAAGTSPQDDVLTELTAEDYFMPGATLSVLARPSRFISLMAAFKMAQGFDGSGTLRFTTGAYQQGALDGEPQPFVNSTIDLQRVQVSLPWALTLAGRFAMPRDGNLAFDAPVAELSDALVDELWDVEFDFTYNLAARASQNRVDVGGDVALQFRAADGSPQTPLLVPQADIEALEVDRHLTNSVAARLGGSFNVLPARLAISAGGFFESRGVDPAFVSVDSFALARFGLGMGLRLRVGVFDLQFAYQHVFQEVLEVIPPQHAARDTATDEPTSGFDQRIYRDGELSAGAVADPEAPARGDAQAAGQQSALFETDDRRARVINAGRYVASFDLLSVGASYRF